MGIVTTLVECMKDEGFGMREWTLICQRAVEIICFAFVDDTDLIHVNHDRSIPTTR